jgi:2-polyprenyl-6-methoxyphenol hydroxylase-like FAD-dependent oxidoreductase
MNQAYDAIIVGGRCAGAPLAMLLARKGHRVLLVDRATFPSDTVSTHLIQPLGVALLARWGLLPKLVATGCPPIDTFAFDFGPFTLRGAPGTAESPVAYSPRRTVLDKLLIDAAAQAGAEVREGFTVEEVLQEDGRVVGIKGHGKDGTPVVERAQVVVGADGQHSLVARAVNAERYGERPAVLASYYSYFSGVPASSTFEIFIRPSRGFAAMPTHDGQTLVIAGWPHAEFEANKKDVEGNFWKTLELQPAFAARIRAGKREARFAGAVVPNYFRKPHGAGWILVGDAGYIKDPITAQGISDAFHDAERAAAALDESFSGARPFDQVMADYQRTRDGRVAAIYDFTYGLATLQPPPPEMQQLLGAIHGNRAAMDGFAQMNAGTISPAQFLAPANIGAIITLAAQGERGGAHAAPQPGAPI